MTAITAIATLIGVVIGAAFLLAGGVLLPLWQLTEDRKKTFGSTAPTGVDVDIPRGEAAIAVISSSDCGKSTLVNAPPRPTDQLLPGKVAGRACWRHGQQHHGRPTAPVQFQWL